MKKSVQNKLKIAFISWTIWHKFIMEKQVTNFFLCLPT